jgi:hypothetical protein
MAAWEARESSPEVIDSIGISETISLVEERFAGIVSDYMQAWAAETDGDSELFAQLLVHIQESVTSEAVALWQATGWHAGWFERACRRKVDDALGARVKTWKSLARKYEIQHLEDSHISLLSIVQAGGDLKIAFEFDQSQRVLDSMRTYLEPEPRKTNQSMTSPDRSTPPLEVNRGEPYRAISTNGLDESVISKGDSSPQTAITTALSDALGDWYRDGGTKAVSEFSNAARALEGLGSVDLSAALRPIIDAAAAIEDVDLTGKGFREALEASACALEGIDVAAVSKLFDSAALAATQTDFDHVHFTENVQELQNAGALVLRGIDLQDLDQAVAPLTEAARAAHEIGIQAQSAVRQLQSAVSIKPPASIGEGSSSQAPNATLEISSPERDETPEMLIEGYLDAHPEIPNYDALAEKIGISRDVLFAIKGETRWVRAVAYECTAELIGCPMLALHPRVLVRRRRRGKSNQKSDAKSDQ